MIYEIWYFHGCYYMDYDFLGCVLLDSLADWYLHILGWAASYRTGQQS